MTGGMGVWKNGINSCGIARALDVPGAIAVGSYTYDANFTSTGGCGTADNRDVVDFGLIADSGVLARTCTWSTAGGAPYDKDIRIDTSTRSWVTTTGCSGTNYDLRSVVTHELGHMLALGHATEFGDNDLTMSPNSASCNSSARTLGAGDVSSIYVQHGGECLSRIRRRLSLDPPMGRLAELAS